MKTKIVSLIIALMGFNINAAQAEDSTLKGNLGAKVTSDYQRRGEIISEQSVQAQIGLNSAVGGVDIFADFFTNQSTDSGRDSNEIVAGLGKDFFEGLVSAYGGVYNTDFSDAEADLEYFVQVSVNAPLNPSVSFFRNVDDELNTFEGKISQDFDIKLANLELSGVLGNTELTQSVDSTYSAVRVELSKQFDEVELYADVSLSDNDTRDYETIYGVGIRVKF
jgi:hypothetical protein